MRDMWVEDLNEIPTPTATQRRVDVMNEQTFKEHLVLMMLRLWNTAYCVGHNDTVEGDFVDIAPYVETDTTFEETVKEWLNDEICQGTTQIGLCDE